MKKSIGKNDWSTEQIKKMSVTLSHSRGLSLRAYNICQKSGLYECTSSDMSMRLKQNLVSDCLRQPISLDIARTVSGKLPNTEFQQFRRPLIEAYIDMSCDTPTGRARVCRPREIKRALFVDENPHDIVGMSKRIARSLRLRARSHRLRH